MTDLAPTTPEQVEALFDKVRMQYPAFVSDWKKSSLAAQTAVDDIADVMEWLREDRHFAQADRLRTIAGRLARSVPPYPVFGGLDAPDLIRNLARTWPDQLSIKESKRLVEENQRLKKENATLRALVPD
jgi:hypothetical protein